MWEGVVIILSHLLRHQSGTGNTRSVLLCVPSASLRRDLCVDTAAHASEQTKMNKSTTRGQEQPAFVTAYSGAECSCCS